MDLDMGLDDWWKHIPGLPVRFEASKAGQIRVRSYESTYVDKWGNTITRHVAGRVLKPFPGTGSGARRDTLVVKLNLGGSREHQNYSHLRVDHLVLAAHKGRPFDRHDPRVRVLWTVRHLDGDLLNCALENLEWMHVVNGEVDPARYEANRQILAGRDLTVDSFMAKFYGGEAA